MLCIAFVQAMPLALKMHRERPGIIARRVINTHAGGFLKKPISVIMMSSLLLSTRQWEAR